jgi:hypothetical protein
MSSEWNNLRRAKRQNMSYGCRVVDTAGTVLGTCTICDISDGGARLQLRGQLTVPDAFILHLSNQGTPRRCCRVVWRKDTEIGVFFEKEGAALRP